MFPELLTNPGLSNPQSQHSPLVDRLKEAADKDPAQQPAWAHDHTGTNTKPEPKTKSKAGTSFLVTLGVGARLVTEPLGLLCGLIAWGRP